LADLLTIYEKKKTLTGQTLAFIGDGNNIANSLALAAGLTGINFRIASPEGYKLADDILSEAQEYAAVNGGQIVSLTDPVEAAAGADIVYTDVWTSMGQEEENAQRQKAFSKYRVDRELLKKAKPDAIVMHDLPAHRGEEITDEVIEGPQSVVFDQAENRMHAQKALLASMLGGLEIPLAGFNRR
jgi:ornithine carbamoyltransferase